MNEPSPVRKLMRKIIILVVAQYTKITEARR